MLLLSIVALLTTLTLFKLIYNKYRKDYFIINIMNKKEEHIFKYYIYENKNWDKCDTYIIGNPSAIAINSMFIDEFGGLESYYRLNEKMAFKDPLLNIEGFYVFKEITYPYVPNKDIIKSDISEIYINFIKGRDLNLDTYQDNDLTNKINLSIIYIQVHILKNNKTDVDPRLFIERIKKIDGKNKFLIYTIKTQVSTEYVHMIPSDVSKSEEMLRDDFINSLFNKERKNILNFLNKVTKPEHIDLCYRKNTNMMLYGPSGSGKSITVCKIAEYLSKSVIDIDILNMTKKVFYNIMPDFDDHIYLFDDIDKILCNSDNSLVEINDLVNMLNNIKSNQGQLVILTTTNITKVKELCPRLFTSCHLKLFNIDYVDFDCLQNISEHYFKQKLSLFPTNINIPTTDIVAFAEEYSGSPDGFGLFELYIQSRINNL